MSVLLDKLADATLRHPTAPIGQPIVCRECGCDDYHACVDARGQPCSWFSIDITLPTGICTHCAAEIGWQAFFLCDDPLADAA